jgi:uncharacterized protein YegP (UPF0339 family)
MNGKYTLHPTGTEFHWVLKARDAQTMLSSQMYSAKASAEEGIAACRINSAIDARYERLAAHDKRPYFVLRAANGEIIGASQIYSTDAGREKGIALCKESGPLATIAYS